METASARRDVNSCLDIFVSPREESSEASLEASSEASSLSRRIAHSRVGAAPVRSSSNASTASARSSASSSISASEANVFVCFGASSVSDARARRFPREDDDVFDDVFVASV